MVDPVLSVRHLSVDFKTDDRPDSQPQYGAQLRLYAAAIEAATGEKVTSAVLLAV